MKKIAILYGHVASNFGDVAITQGLHDLLKTNKELDVTFIFPAVGHVAKPHFADLLERCPELKYTFYDPKKSVKRFNLFFKRLGKNREADSSSITNKYAFELGLKGFDHLLVNSSEFLFSYGNDLQDKLILGRMDCMLAGIHLGIPITILPSTFGPFTKSGYATYLIDYLIHRSEGFAFRDAHSRYFLPFQNAKHKEAPDLLDPAFFIKDLPSNPIEKETIGIIPRLEAYGLRKGVISSRDTIKMLRKTPRKIQSLMLYRDVILKLNAKQKHCTIIAQTISDKEFTSKLHSICIESAKHPELIELSQPINYDDYFRAISTCHSIITSRFHAIIIGALYGIGSIGIKLPNGGHKISGLLALLEKSGSYACSEIDNATSVIRRFEKMTSEYEEYKISLNSKIKDLRKLTKNWIFEQLNDKK